MLLTMRTVRTSPSLMSSWQWAWPSGKLKRSHIHMETSAAILEDSLCRGRLSSVVM